MRAIERTRHRQTLIGPVPGAVAYRVDRLEDEHALAHACRIEIEIQILRQTERGFPREDRLIVEVAELHLDLANGSRVADQFQTRL